MGTAGPDEPTGGERVSRDDPTTRSAGGPVGDAVIGSSLESVIVIDHEGRIVEFNPAAERTLGYQRAAVVGRPMADVLIPPDMREAHLRGFARYQATGQGTMIGRRVELLALRADGRRVPVEVAITRVPRDPPLFVGFLRDLSLQRDTEDALRASDLRYRTLVERLPAIVYIDTVDDRSSNLYISPQVESILGYPPAAFETNNDLWPSLIHPDDREHALAGMVLAQQASGPFSSEYRFVAQDGRVVWIRDESVAIRDETGRPRYLHGLLFDITAQKLAEQALVASEARFRELLRDVRLLAVIVDMDGRVTFANDFLCELAGLSPGDVLGTDWFERFVPADRAAAFRRGHHERLARAEAGSSLEGEVLTRDGQRRTIIWNNALVRDLTGAISGVASIGDDITERRQVEAQLREANKLQALGQLAAGIAHDFNNLLTSIGGYTEALLAAHPEQDRERADLDQIRLAAERAAGLTDQLLAFARRQPLRPEILDVGQLLANLGPELRGLVGPGVEVDWQLGRDVGRVFADRSQLERAIVNLALNAAEAMPDGGRLTIEAAATTLVAEDQAGSPELSPGRYVGLTVRDTGRGIASDIVDRVFEPFFTTKDRGVEPGAGMGLSTVHGIVRQSGGSIALESKPGAGSSFRILLPRVDAATALPAPSTGQGQQPLTVQTSAREAPRTILLVEDDEPVRALVARLLRAHGYDVLEAEHGAAAVDLAEQHPGSISLLLSDVIMPGMRGAEVASRVAALQPGIGVIFLSGYPEDVIVRDGILEPGVAFVHKPFSSAGLLSKVAEVLAATGGQTSGTSGGGSQARPATG